MQKKFIYFVCLHFFCFIAGTVLLPSLLTTPVRAYAEETVESSEKPFIITAMGEGQNKHEAVNAALRDAVEQACGVYIESYTQVKDFTVIEDKIETFSRGFAKNYDVLDEGKNPDGNYWVKIQAEVTDEIRHVLQDTFAAMGIQLRQTENREVAVVVEDSDIAQLGFNADGIQMRINSQLGKNGFEYIILSQASEAISEQRKIIIETLKEEYPNERLTQVPYFPGISVPESQVTQVLIQLIRDKYKAFYTIKVRLDKESEQEALLSAEIFEMATGKGAGSAVSQLHLNKSRGTELQTAIDNLFNPETGLVTLMYKYLERDKQQGGTVKLLISNYNKICGQMLTELLSKEEKYRLDTMGGGEISYTVWTKNISLLKDKLTNELEPCLNEQDPTKSIITRNNRILIKFEKRRK